VAVKDQVVTVVDVGPSHRCKRGGMMHRPGLRGREKIREQAVPWAVDLLRGWLRSSIDLGPLLRLHQFKLRGIGREQPARHFLSEIGGIPGEEELRMRER